VRGAKPPRLVPVWLARLLAGDQAVVMMTEGRAFSNAKAKRELGWVVLRYPSWRQGFRASGLQGFREELAGTGGARVTDGPAVSSRE
jgi:hypothetical protein